MSSLDIATRALTSNLSALQVIGHNIANVNTEGYSRQTVQMAAVDGQKVGNAYYGKGVEIGSVTRSYDKLLTQEAQSTKSLSASDEVQFRRLQQLEELFPMGDSGLGSILNKALNAWVDVAASPTDLTARTVALTSAQEFAQRINNVTKSLDELRTSSLQQIDATVDAINGLTSQLAKLNARIIEGTGSGNLPNDLLDQRDQLVSKLNQYVQTTQVVSENGAMTVFMGSSIPLVLGTQNFNLRRGDPNGPEGVNLPLDPLQVGLVVDRAGQPFAIDNSLLRGGELNGLVKYVNSDLKDTANQLGRFAMSLGMQMNDQHRLGLDLNGQPGGNFFSLEGGQLAMTALGQVTIQGLSSVGASGQAQAVVTDPNAMIASDYEIRFTGAAAGYITRLSDGAVRDFSYTAGAFDVDDAAGNPSGSNEWDGLAFQSDPSNAISAPGVNHRYLISPFADASRNINLAISQPQGLAAASPLVMEPSFGAQSSLGVEKFAIVGSSDTLPSTLTPVTLTYDQSTGKFSLPTPLPSGISAAQFEDASTSKPYSPGQPLTFTVTQSPSGVEVTYSVIMRGTPQDGDQFTLRSPAAGENTKLNAGNAQSILGLRDVPSFEGVALSDGYINVFSLVASKVQAGKFAAEFSATKAATAETARANVSGVNLDEEAAKLLQYQQSYQAAAKYLQTAQSIFDNFLRSLS